MPKNNLFAEKEMVGFVLDEWLLRDIEICRRQLHLEKADMHILDWGCGKGRSVVYLKEQGYDAFGVDVQDESLRIGKELFLKGGWVPERSLILIGDDSKTSFPDNYFHFIFSEQTFDKRHYLVSRMIFRRHWRITLVYHRLKMKRLG